MELETQFASDSANLITATGNVTQAKYVLMAYMNIDAGRSFDIEEPPMEKIPVEPIGDLQPENVYASSVSKPAAAKNE